MHDCGTPGRYQNHKKENMSASTVLVIIIIVFVICETPELIVRTVTLIDRYTSEENFGMSDEQSGEFYKIFNTVSQVFMVLNSTVNFFIYCAFGSRFRKHLRAALRRPGSSLATDELVPMNNHNGPRAV